MKTFIISLLLFFATAVASFGQTNLNGVFYVDNAVECHLITQNGSSQTNALTAGKTYMVTDSALVELVSSNKTTFYLSGGPMIEVSPSSVFSIDVFDQEIKNLESQPRRAEFGSHNISITLGIGEFSIIYPNTNADSILTVNTPFATYVLQSGKYFFRISDKSAIVYVVEGMMQMHGEKNRVDDTKKGSLAVAIPFVDPGSGLPDKILTSIKTLKDEENERYTTPVLLAEKKWANVGFIVVGGKVIGVWLK